MKRSHHRVRVAEVVPETTDARSFVLAVPAELAGDFAYRAGQFLTVRIPGPTGGFAGRCYSLSSSPLHQPAPDDSDPDTGPRMTITVKRVADGHGSNWLCDNVIVGSTLEVLPPAGTFTPHDLDTDFLLFAAGSGITPVMSILRTALTGGTGQVRLVYANRDEDSVIFAGELERLGGLHPGRLRTVHWLESGPQGRGLPNSAALRDLAASLVGSGSPEVYVCGPEPFMAESVRAAELLGVPADRIHVERFILPPDEPADDLEDEKPEVGKLEVELDGERHRLAWPATVRMLDVMLNNGLDAPFSCRQGQCAACTCRLEQGQVSMIHNDVLDAEDLAEGYILACQALPVSDEVRISYD